jgi:hypothetical protein
MYVGDDNNSHCPTTKWQADDCGLSLQAAMDPACVLQGWTPTPCNGQISMKKENGPDVTRCDD